MKKLKNKFGLFLLLLLAVWSCQDDDKEFGDIKTPGDIDLTFEIQGQDAENIHGDGSGLVKFTAVADNALSYKYIFSDGTTITSPTGITNPMKRFTTNGVVTYQVTVVATGTAGVANTFTTEITVFSNFTDPVAVEALTGGTSKKWYWAAAEPGHLGVGENSSNPELNSWPNYYSAAPFEKAGSPDSNCLYEFEMTFTLQNDGTLTYISDNNGRTFFNAAFNSVGGGGGGTDLCLNFNTSGERVVQLSPSESILAGTDATTGTSMIFTDGGFMGYYIGQNTYEILEITNNRMVVRAIAGNDATLAWYHTFTTTPIDEQTSGGDNTDYTNLVWSDEFDVNGAPDPSKWGYDIGTGDSGWGNQEAQYYTNRPENVIVQNGNLVITAKAENYLGANYTSARLKSEGLYDFTYGKVEFRAKLPVGGGTWPAAWMLGANFEDVGWPQCGEIDVMEHKGNVPGVIHGTLHYPGNSGGNANGNTTTVANVSSEYHIYSVIWSPTSIRFFVDGNLFHSYNNNASSPYNADFFLILNFAMGGTFGGAIDPAFEQSTFEIDYVRVYQ